MHTTAYQAVVLAGGEDALLFPLTTNVVKALLPVANKPLISYSLKTLADAGLRSVIVVVIGDKAASSVSAWISQEYSGQKILQCEVVSVPEGYGTADALRAVAGRITAPTFVVLSGDLLTDVPVNALVASHQLHSALVTMLLAKRRVSPASETKPGKAPKDVDYIGMDHAAEHLLYYAASSSAGGGLRDLKLPLPLVRQYGAISVRSDLVDAHLYVFDRQVLAVLEANPKLSSLRQDMLPYLTQNQLRLRQQRQQNATSSDMMALGRASSVAGDNAGGGAGEPRGRSGSGSGAEELPAAGSSVAGDGAGGAKAEFKLGESISDMTHSSVAGHARSLLRVQVVDPRDGNGIYCARVHDVQAYGDVNRDVADPGIALKLAGLKPTRFDNIVAASTVIGNKTTVAAACIVGENGVLGDKSSIKRSVLGHNCKLGGNVKVINSVLMDGVTVGDGAHVQNSIICTGVAIPAGTTLRDCQVGVGAIVAAGVEYKSEVLAAGTKATK